MRDNIMNTVSGGDWFSGLQPRAARTPQQCRHTGCRCRMDKHFKSLKRARRRGKGSGERVKSRVCTEDNPPTPVEQGEGIEDVLLFKKHGEDGRRVTCWRPQSSSSLRGVEYIPIQQIVTTVTQAATRDAEGRRSLQLINLKEHHYTSLKVWVPGYPLEGVLFVLSRHPREGQVTLQLDFPTAMRYLKKFYDTSIHLLEIVEDETQATSRFLVGSILDPRMPHLPTYSLDEPGGPWFRDRNFNHSFPKRIRSYNSASHLPHNLEFFLSVNSEQMTRLGELCSETGSNSREVTTRK